MTTLVDPSFLSVELPCMQLAPIICAWCQLVTGAKVQDGIGHSICRDCSAKQLAGIKETQ
jgi:hypothetical protein